MTSGGAEDRPPGRGLLVDGPVLAVPHRAAEPARSMAVADGRVVAVGDQDRCRRALALRGTVDPEVLRLPPGAVVVPGFVDPHVHLLAMAAARCSLDLAGAGDGPGVRARLGAAGGSGWLRAVGWDESLGHGPLARTDLDAACPGRPVVVHHATGYLVVLSTAASAAVGLDPADGGDGVLPAHHPALAHVPRLDSVTLDAALADVDADLAAAGVVAVGDATATNGAAEARRLTSAGLSVRVEAMVGIHAVADTPPGSRIKIVVDDATTAADLAVQIATAHRLGHPVALHVVDVGPLHVALEALAAAPGPPAGHRDRLEHVSLCLPEQVDRIAGSGAAVVTQPGFLLHRGDKYRALSDVEQAWLYRLGTLLAAGVHVAASSDAPVVPPRPLEAVQAMVTRDDPAERVDIDVALDLVTRRAAAVSGSETEGELRAGASADFIVLGADPHVVEAGQIRTIPVVGTWVGGRRVSTREYGSAARRPCRVGAGEVVR